MKRCSTSLITREMKSKLLEIPSDISQNGYHQKVYKEMLARMWRKGNPSIPLLGMWIGTVNMENGMESPQKTRNRTTMWPSSFMPGHISRENENTHSIRYRPPNVKTALFTIDTETSKCPSTDEWTKMFLYTHTHAHTEEYYSAIKKNENLPFATPWMV